MSILFPDFLRALVSSSMNIFLMLSLLQPKYGRKVTNFTMLGILVAELMVSVFCYISGNLTLLARLDLLIFTVLCFLIRPLFKDSFMQWLFTYLTVQNIAMCIIVLSFSISRVMPYPMYANTFLRLILFSGIIFVIRRYMYPLYRQIVIHWNVFFYMALAIFIAFVYYFTAGEDIVQTLITQAVPIHLLVLITVTIYISIFYSIQTVSKEYKLRDENLHMKSNQELLHLSACAMADRIKLLDEAQQQSSIVAHDRRHFNNTLIELLERKKTEDAIEFLRKQSNIKSSKLKNYCENAVINAAVSYYIDLAEKNGISTDISLDIPSFLTIDSLGLAMVISNLIENAIQACKVLKVDREQRIWFTCRYAGRLILEISNTCDATVALNESGLPVAKESGHGVGTKSVLAFAEANEAEIFYQILDGIFRVRMLI